MTNRLQLADWRRQTAELYAWVRQEAAVDPLGAARHYRAARDELFRTHPQTALTPAQRQTFTGLNYFAYDPTFRVAGRVDLNVAPDLFDVPLRDDGGLRYRRIGRVAFELRGAQASLNVYWLEGYGGGIFLPFGDATNGRSTFGGGRYLYDTIKGADLGACDDSLQLDFNYAYNPSCAYNTQWVCPLTPAENRLEIEIPAGEKGFGIIP